MKVMMDTFLMRVTRSTYTMTALELLLYRFDGTAGTAKHSVHGQNATR